MTTKTVGISKGLGLSMVAGALLLATQSIALASQTNRLGQTESAAGRAVVTGPMSPHSWTTAATAGLDPSIFHPPGSVPTFDPSIFHPPHSVAGLDPSIFHPPHSVAGLDPSIFHPPHSVAGLDPSIFHPPHSVAGLDPSIFHPPGTVPTFEPSLSHTWG